MSEFKKSKKMDSQKSGETCDLGNLIEDIEQAEQEADPQIRTLETRTKEIQELSQHLFSVTENLREFEGEALQAVQQQIDQEIQIKADEAEKCEHKLQEINAKMQEKQSEIQGEISNRDSAISEIETAEKDCDVDLSDAKNAANDEKQTLEDANSKLEELLSKINGALENQAGVKTDILKNCMDSAQNWLGEKLHDAVKTGKNIQTTLMIGASLYGGMLTKIMNDFVQPLTDDINSSVFVPLAGKDSGFSIIKDTLDQAKEYHGIDSDFSDLDSSRDVDKDRRKRESEILGEVRNKPEITSK
jgi:hypothetical protein